MAVSAFVRSRNEGPDDGGPFSSSTEFALPGVLAPYPLGCDVILSLDVVLINGVVFRAGGGLLAELVAVEFWEPGDTEEVMKLIGLGSELP